MQTQLPFYPVSTKLINATLGFREQDGFVYYLHNGNPIFCHGKDDLSSRPGHFSPSLSQNRA